MKLTKVITAVLATLGLVAVVALSTPNVDAQASVHNSLASFPAKYQGTWYYYHKGHYNTFKIEATKSGARNFTGGKWQSGEAPVKVIDLNKTPKSNKSNRYDEVLFMSKGWLMNIDRESYEKGAKYHSVGSEAYKVVSRNYKGKKVQSLYCDDMYNAGNGESHLFHYYKTKGQAKAFNPTGLAEDYPGW